MVLPLIAAAVAGVGVAIASRRLHKDAGKFEVTVDMDSVTEAHLFRQNPLAQCTQTMTMNAHEIYQRVHGGPGPDTLHTAAEATKVLANRYVTRAAQIERLRGQMADAWRGSAADNSLAHTRPLSDALEQTRGLLADSSGPLARQVDAFTDVYHKVEDVPAKPPKSNLLNDSLPFHTDTDAAISSYNTKASKNVQAYKDYHGASTGNGAQLPHEFPAPPVDRSRLPVVIRQVGSPVGYRGGAPQPGQVNAPRSTTQARPGSAAGQSPQVNGPTPSVATSAQGSLPTPSTAPATTTAAAAIPTSGGSGGGGGTVSGPIVAGQPQGPRAGVDGRDAAGPRTGLGTPVRQPALPTTGATVGGPRAGTNTTTGIPAAGSRAKDEKDAEHRRKYWDKDEKRKTPFDPDEDYFPPVIK